MSALVCASLFIFQRESSQIFTAAILCSVNSQVALAGWKTPTYFFSGRPFARSSLQVGKYFALPAAEAAPVQNSFIFIPHPSFPICFLSRCYRIEARVTVCKITENICASADCLFSPLTHLSFGLVSGNVRSAQLGNRPFLGGVGGRKRTVLSHKE